MLPIEQMVEYMLDTSAIGEIAEGEIGAKTLYTTTDRFYVTHIQKDELKAAGGYARVLLNVIEVVDATENATEGMIFGISRLGAAKLGRGEYMGEMLDSMPPDDNNMKDVLIAETAIQNGYTLVADDKNLKNTVNENTPGNAISVSKLRRRLNQ